MLQSNNTVLIVRNRRCRKSDVVVRFLEQEGIPHRVLYLGENAEADALAQQYNLKASPGIIVNGESVNPYHLVEKCRIKDTENAKKRLRQLLREVTE